jgi:O-acetyl-ADP-ribose deacetylase (regulator of RNase III)
MSSGAGSEWTGTPGFPFVIHTPTMRVPKAVDGTDAVYIATWASLVASYRYNLASDEKIRLVGMPAMGAGFDNVPFREAARQMAVACENFLHPPAALDWDAIIERHKRLSYDGDDKVVN